MILIDPRINPELTVMQLGEAIGYGNLMQLSERLWGDKLEQRDESRGGACSVGPRVSALVPCPGPQHDEFYDGNDICDWCCGASRVTERVARAMMEENR